MRRHLLFVCLVLLTSACASRSASTREPAPVASPVEASAEVPVPASAAAAQVAPPVVPAADAPQATAPSQVALAHAASAASAVDEEDELEEPSADEGETFDEAATTNADPSLRYSGDIPDDVLEEWWTKSPEKLGSVSFGYAHEGRLLNAVQFPKGEGWLLVTPHNAWATQETIDYVVTAIEAVRAQFPDSPPLRVNQISGQEGGYLRPHKSHQNGRDVDLGFYYPTAEPVRVRERERYIDVARNWALVKALVTRTDVQLILVDKRVQRVLYDYALAQGEDQAWLDSIFNAGVDSIVKHARRHRDHFHVRFYNGRAQELGRRLSPLLALRPEQNIAIHRVRSGDTLSQIAVRYGSSVAALRKANRIRGSLLRISQVLKVPLRGPCTRCPLPPAVTLPERRLPPNFAAAPAAETPAAEATAPVELPASEVQPEEPQPPAEPEAPTSDAPVPVVGA